MQIGNDTSTFQLFGAVFAEQLLSASRMIIETV